MEESCVDDRGSTVQKPIAGGYLELAECGFTDGKANLT
jgi:hypothetical protein